VDPSVVLPDHHESATTDVSRDWMDHGERERHGHGGVDRLPPRRRMPTPTSLASGCDVTTMACSPATGLTR